MPSLFLKLDITFKLEKILWLSISFIHDWFQDLLSQWNCDHLSEMIYWVDRAKMFIPINKTKKLCYDTKSTNELYMIHIINQGLFHTTRWQRLIAPSAVGWTRVLKQSSFYFLEKNLFIDKPEYGHNFFFLKRYAAVKLKLNVKVTYGSIKKWIPADLWLDFL